MKKKPFIIIVCMSIILLSACTEKSSQDKSLETSTKQSITSTKVSNSQIKTSKSSETSETTNQEMGFTEETVERVVESPVELGTIYYQDLDVNEPIQANAQYLGCYIVDDGSTVNFIPLMAGTVQGLYMYTSGQGNEDYYQQFLDKAIETSNLTGGKPVSIFDREDGEVIITAENGEIIFSL